MKKSISILIITLSFSTAAFARDWYVDSGLGFINFDDGNNSISPTNLYLRGGYQYNKYYNFGLESSFTVSPDQISDADIDVNTLTFYGRGGTPVNKYLWVYAQLGWTSTEVNNSNNNDLMYGLGVEAYPLNKPIYIALNYSSYFRKSGDDVTAFNLGIGYRF
jgi:hypothetical protein